MDWTTKSSQSGDGRNVSTGARIMYPGNTNSLPGILGRKESCSAIVHQQNSPTTFQLLFLDRQQYQIQHFYDPPSAPSYPSSLSTRSIISILNSSPCSGSGLQHDASITSASLATALSPTTILWTRMISQTER